MINLPNLHLAQKKENIHGHQSDIKRHMHGLLGCIHAPSRILTPAAPIRPQACTILCGAAGLWWNCFIIGLLLRPHQNPGREDRQLKNRHNLPMKKPPLGGFSIPVN